MIEPSHLKALTILYTRLKNTAINWAFTGSLGFALQGVPVEPHDIDVQTDEAGAFAIEQLCSEYVVSPVKFWASERMQSHFGVLAIEDITVEIMGGIQKLREDSMWEEPIEIEQHRRFVQVEDMLIPVLSLEYEYQAYLMMGRVEKAQLIQETIARQGQ